MARAKSAKGIQNRRGIGDEVFCRFVLSEKASRKAAVLRWLSRKSHNEGQERVKRVEFLLRQDNVTGYRDLVVQRSSCGSGDGPGRALEWGKLVDRI